jgi:hypothetical protein
MNGGETTLNPQALPVLPNSTPTTRGLLPLNPPSDNSLFDEPQAPTNYA